MKIGFDFDGVFAIVTKLKYELASLYFGKHINFAKYKTEEILAHGWLSVVEQKELQGLVYRDPVYGLAIEAVEGCFDYLRMILSRGHGIKIISSRHEVSLEIATTWLKKHGWDIPIVGVPNNGPKTEAVRGLDVYIDDSADKLRPLIGVVPYLYLFHWEYNASDDISSLAQRIYSWNDFYEKIKILEDRQL